MSNYGLTLNVPIAAAVLGKRLAYEDPATGSAANPNVVRAKCMGVFPEDVSAAEGMAPIQVDGVVEVVSGGAINIGDSLMGDANARVVVAAGAANDKIWCIGFARSRSAAAGDIVDVLLHPHMVVI